MFDGKLMGIIATTALELGVDIGSLDAVITVGFPIPLLTFDSRVDERVEGIKTLYLY